MKKNEIEKLRNERSPVHEKCLGIGFTEEEKKFFVEKKSRCSKVIEVISDITGDTENLCATYIKPSVFWNRGGCPVADHYRPDLFSETKNAKRVGQQKQKKKK